MDGTRRFTRAKVAIDAELWVSGSQAATRVKGQITALDPAGAFVAISEAYPRGTIVGVRFKPPAAPKKITCTAIVRYSRKGKGIGVEFLEIPEPVRRHIHQVVRRLARR